MGEEFKINQWFSLVPLNLGTMSVHYVIWGLLLAGTTIPMAYMLIVTLN